MLTEKKLIKLLRDVAENTANPFSINDVAIYMNLPRNSYGLEVLDGEYGVNGKRIGHLVQKHSDFEKFDGVSNGKVKWWCISVRDRHKEKDISNINDNLEL